MANVFIKLELRNEYSDEITQRIDRVMNSLIFSPKEMTKKEKEKKIPIFNFSLFSDFSSPDHNRSILDGLLEAFSDDVPIFTTTSLISAQDLDLDEVNLDEVKSAAREEFHELRGRLKCLVRRGKWDIFRAKEILLFLPSEKNMTLNQLGLHRNKFTQISDLEKIFEGPTSQPSLEQFLQLFNLKKRTKKRVFLKGHGNATDEMGGFKFEEYRTLLKFLDTNDGEFLSVTSCKSGAGKNSSQHYIVEKGVCRGPNFPIGVRSIGAYNAGDDIKVSRYLQELAEVIGKGGRFTTQDYKEGVKKAKNKRLFEDVSDIYSTMQIRFPHSGNWLERGGFRPLCELKMSYALTYNELQRNKLESLLDFEKRTSSRIEQERKPLEIRLDEKNVLFILPLVIDIPISWLGLSQIFVSMVPGTAHHLFASLEIHHPISRYKIPLSNFIKNIKAFQAEKKGSENKAFFIGKLQCRKEYFQVVISFFNGKLFYLYGVYEGGNKQYWMGDDNGEQQISEEKFGSIAFQIALDTKPQEESVRAATGGQQGESDFRSALQNEFFWNEDCPLPELIKTYLKFSSKKHLSKAEKKKLQKLDNPLLQELFAYAVKDEHLELISVLLKNSQIEPNPIDYKGHPLLLKPFKQIKSKSPRLC
jgi:hypothetical protein